MAPHTGNLTKVLLHDQTFVEQLNSVFEEFKKDNINLDEQVKWDLCKITQENFVFSTVNARNEVSKVGT